MRLNSKNCKEMVVNFVYKKPNGNKNFIIQIAWRVIINEHLKWNCHVDYITSKASKKLYAVRLLRRDGVEEQDMLKFSRSSVGPILKYTLQLWQDIPDYLSDRIESVQKRALNIIYRNSSYSQALSLANETTLNF